MSSELRDADGETPTSVGRTGQVLDERYRLECEIGSGSSGIVWAARDTTTNERVAIKILHASLVPSPSARARFHREIASATALDHPHSVRVLGDGVTADGADFLVMERLDGRSLRETLADGPLPQVRAIGIAAQILEATAEAHRHGIVHRDLKPGNIILLAREDQADFVKVCDYGLAKLFESRNRESTVAANMPNFATVQGVLCGTPAYMSPEQARGDDVDGRSDLYSIGVMLFRMVVGRLPFEARNATEALDATLTQPPPSPRALRPDLEIAPPLEALILRALAKDRRERPSSAEGLRADLLQVARDLERDEPAPARQRAPSRSGDTVPALDVAPRAAPRASERRRAPVRAVALGVGVLSLATVAARAWYARSPGFPAVPPRALVEAVHRDPERAPELPAPTHPIEAHPPPVAERPIEKTRAGAVPRPPAAPPPVAAAPAVEPTIPSAQPVGDTEATGLLRSGEEALARGNIEAAHAIGLSAAAREPSNARTWELLGRCTMRLGRSEEARDYYRRALALAPNGPKAAFIRAIVESGGASPAP